MPIVCEERDTELLMYAQGQLSPLARAKVWLHLRKCHACRCRVDDFVFVTRVLQAHLGPVGASWAAPTRVPQNLKVAGAGLLAAVAVVIASFSGMASQGNMPAFGGRDGSAINPPPGVGNVSADCARCHTPTELASYREREDKGEVPIHWDGTSSALWNLKRLRESGQAPSPEGK